MKIGVIGLGRMGTAIAHRLHQQGFDVAGWDQNAAANQALAASALAKIPARLPLIPMS